MHFNISRNSALSALPRGSALQVIKTYHFVKLGSVREFFAISSGVLNKQR